MFRLSAAGLINGKVAIDVNHSIHFLITLHGWEGMFFAYKEIPIEAFTSERRDGCIRRYPGAHQIPLENLPTQVKSCIESVMECEPYAESEYIASFEFLTGCLHDLDLSEYEDHLIDVFRRLRRVTIENRLSEAATNAGIKCLLALGMQDDETFLYNLACEGYLNWLADLCSTPRQVRYDGIVYQILSRMSEKSKRLHDCSVRMLSVEQLSGLIRGNSGAYIEFKAELLCAFCSFPLSSDETRSVYRIFHFLLSQGPISVLRWVVKGTYYVVRRDPIVDDYFFQAGLLDLMLSRLGEDPLAAEYILYFINLIFHRKCSAQINIPIDRICSFIDCPVGQLQMAAAVTLGGLAEDRQFLFDECNVAIVISRLCHACDNANFNGKKYLMIAFVHLVRLKSPDMIVHLCLTDDIVMQVVCGLIMQRGDHEIDFFICFLEDLFAEARRLGRGDLFCDRFRAYGGFDYLEEVARNEDCDDLGRINAFVTLYGDKTPCAM
jgi:hypothetical protein